MKSVYIVTGAKGVGKSTAVGRFCAPTKDAMASTLIIDTEDSFSDIMRQNDELGLSYGKYIRAYERFKDKDLLHNIASGNLSWSKGQSNALCAYWEWFVETLDNALKSGAFNTVGIDTIEPIEAAMTAWAEANRAKSGWSGVRAYGRMETEAVRPLYDALFEGMHRRKVDNIILSSHLKGVWENLGEDASGKVVTKKILNKVDVGGRVALLSRISTAMFWLVHEPANPNGAPAAIVLKSRAGKTTIANGIWQTTRPLPPRIPAFTWDAYRRYVRDGVDWTKLTDSERLSESEFRMVSEFLSDEQMRLMVAAQEQMARGVPQESVTIDVGFAQQAVDVSDTEYKPAMTMLERMKQAK